MSDSRCNVNCSAFGCNSLAWRDKEKGISFHRFPKSGRIVYRGDEAVDLRRTWEIELRCGKLASKSMVACSLHFKKEDFVPMKKAGNKCLIKIAIPTQHLPSPRLQKRTEDATRILPQILENDDIVKPHVEENCDCQDEFALHDHNYNLKEISAAELRCLATQKTVRNFKCQLSRAASNNPKKLYMNNQLFPLNSNHKNTFWGKTRLSPSTKSAQTVLLSTNNEYTGLYDEKLPRIDEILLKNENVSGKNSDSEHADYELVIKDELVELIDAREQGDIPDCFDNPEIIKNEEKVDDKNKVSEHVDYELIIKDEPVGFINEYQQSGDIPDCCVIDDKNSDYSFFDDEHGLPFIKVVSMVTPPSTANNFIRVRKEFSISDDSKLESKCTTTGSTKRKKEVLSTNPTPTILGKERVICKESGKIFNRSYIENHLLRHEQELLQCNICGFVVNEKYKLPNLVKQHDKTEPLVCGFCDSVHDNLYDYKNHMEMECENYQYPVYECKVCGKVFALANSLSMHMRAHKNNTNTWCTICQKDFKKPSVYRIHMRIHTGERPYACPYCPRLLKTEGQIKAHVAWHENTGSYTCTHCPKRCTTKAAMKVHVACHDNKRPYTCLLCPKSYKYKVDLQSHVTGHENKREFQCQFCSKKFSHYNSLYKHNRCHKVETFECQYCGRKYRCLRNVRRHIRGSHPETIISRQSTFDVSEHCYARLRKE